MNGNVYFLDITSVNFDENLINDLPVYCQNKINKVNNICLKKSRTLSWYFLKQILLKEYNIDLNKTEIFENHKGKPYIKDIYFNISHSNDYIGIIISEKECGIDIERNVINGNKDRLAQRILTNDEYEDFCRNDEEGILIKKWTKIETYYKIIGEGITLANINNIDFNNVDLDIKSVLLDKDYYLSYGPGNHKIINIKDLNIL